MGSALVRRIEKEADIAASDGEPLENGIRSFHSTQVRSDVRKRTMAFRGLMAGDSPMGGSAAFPARRL